MKVSPDSRRRVAAVLYLVGSVFYVVCGFTHMCMGGHMQHPPYPPSDYFTDGAWVTCYVGAIVISARSSLFLRTAWMACATALIVSRIGGGFFFPVEAPLVLALVIAGLVALFRR